MEVLILFASHIQAIGTYNTLWFWYMVPLPHGLSYIEINILITLFWVALYMQYVHDYFNARLRCCVLYHYFMFYGRLLRLRFMSTSFLLYFVSNDSDKDDKSICSVKIICNYILSTYFFPNRDHGFGIYSVGSHMIRLGSLLLVLMLLLSAVMPTNPNPFKSILKF